MTPDELARSLGIDPKTLRAALVARIEVTPSAESVRAATDAPPGPLQACPESRT